jgi:tetratricopeptide (TPR) repeat protein
MSEINGERGKMIKTNRGSSTNESLEERGKKDTYKKLLVLFSMILIGILLIAYRSNFEYWSEQFVLYNQILFGVSIILLILFFIIFLKDFRNILMHELLGTIIFFVGALILLLIPAGNFLGMEGINENFIVIYALGGIVLVIGTLILMRTGGYFGVCVLSILINTLVSAFYIFGSSSATQYNDNTYLMTNFSILFFIICFILLIYHDLKFFYLAMIIKQEKLFRKKKKYEKALKYCNQAISIYPYFATAWNNKGNILFNMGKKKDAIECYKKALDINPNYEPAKKNIQLVKGA